MDLSSLTYLGFGSIIGLGLRVFLSHKIKIKTGFFINNVAIVNFLASFFFGIFVALNPIDRYLSLSFYFGFLGSFSTFSSFIYQLFILFKRRKFYLLILHYLEVLVISFLLFYCGYYLINFFKWI